MPSGSLTVTFKMFTGDFADTDTQKTHASILRHKITLKNFSSFLTAYLII